jgi:Pentapeptide repeats (8 copies)
VAPAFSASADFAIDKPAGQACPNLRPDFRCGIHARLRQRGFPGCAAYDCFGAGQKVTQGTFGGQDWRRAPGMAAQMFRVFTIMRQLHELLWYLGEALALPAAGPLRTELAQAFEQTERLTRGTPDALETLEMAAYRLDVSGLLRRASELARAGLSGRAAEPGGADLAGADLVGHDLTRAYLRGASLRGAVLVGADLRGADLGGADLTGADLRGADLRGADLAGSIFLTQSQVDAARGDAGTRLPLPLSSPAHWPD